MNDIAANYLDIAKRVAELRPEAVLVSVSKTKPIEDLRAAYEAGCRVFGENYVDEIVAKSGQLPDAEFHMIGHLQSNKVAKVCKCANLAMIHTIDTAELATKVNNALCDERPPLGVLVQVNTSDESQKCGVMHADARLMDLVRHIRENCPKLLFKGIMTIGEIGESERDFACLAKTSENIAEALGIPNEQVKLSMGMSADYEMALQKGSDYVRVGSSIFGARLPKR